MGSTWMGVIKHLKSDQMGNPAPVWVITPMNEVEIAVLLKFLSNRCVRMEETRYDVGGSSGWCCCTQLRTSSALAILKTACESFCASSLDHVRRMALACGMRG